MIAIEDRARLVSVHLYSDSFRDPRSHHIPDCRAPEVMEDLTGKSSLLASLCPHMIIFGDSAAVLPVEDERDNLPALTLNSQGLLSLFPINR